MTLEYFDEPSSHHQYVARLTVTILAAVFFVFICVVIFVVYTLSANYTTPNSKETSVQSNLERGRMVDRRYAPAISVMWIDCTRFVTDFTHSSTESAGQTVKYPYIDGYFVASFPYFNGTVSVYVCIRKSTE